MRSQIDTTQRKKQKPAIIQKSGKDRMQRGLMTILPQLFQFFRQQFKVCVYVFTYDKLWPWDD
jgi:hypothetical protein